MAATFRAMAHGRGLYTCLRRMSKTYVRLSHAYTGRVSQREALLEGALECIQEKGYARTTARDIVAASGTHLASIGYHFGSKDKLLDAALTEGYRRWLGRLAAGVMREGPPLDPAELVNRMARQLPESFEENRGLAVAFVEALPQTQHSEEVRADLAGQYREARTAVATLIEAALAAAGVSGSLDSRTVAGALTAMFDGLLIQWLIDPNDAPSGEALASAGERILDLFAGPLAR